MQTLLAGVRCSEALGLLPGLVAGNPGRRSPRLACPGLRYAALSGLKKTEGGSAQIGETAFHLSAILAWHEVLDLVLQAGVLMYAVVTFPRGRVMDAKCAE